MKIFSYFTFATFLFGLQGQSTAYVVHPRETKVLLRPMKVTVKSGKAKVVLKPKSGTRSHQKTSMTKTPKKTPVARKPWGVDKDNEDEYWFNSHIHTLGNTGFLGALHAAMAPACTKLIDLAAYNGLDIRKKVADELASTFKESKVRVLDMCCGVGLSTRALQNAFPKAEVVVGVDTSPEMISMARLIAVQDSIIRPVMDLARAHLASMSQWAMHPTQAWDGLTRSRIASFRNGNAENTPFPSGSFDLVTIMYAMHEAPKRGRDRILSEVRRLLHSGGTLALIDISPEYMPSPTMLSGEPYVQEYQKNIHRQLSSLKGFTKAAYKTLVPGHVGMWTLKRV